ncbi:hypothetical protein Poly30_12690 [Planctomycetes bacterium Poly30]|uniref:Doubled CXXCH motif (Paired_CXXCH_1) n=1 Tax=Saltatorellus ferox TaxID=2528018 RepID=A0A518ENV5_9BACT|nr:hypothetical protein Poly30_12690 [Planctomycetes bacterium Poly30]
MMLESGREKCSWSEKGQQKTYGRAWRHVSAVAAGFLALALGGCSAGETESLSNGSAETCMTCHNGSPNHDYAGPGLENPHPFEGADNLLCTTCHGGNPLGETVAEAHVPSPPEIGDRAFRETNAFAFFNKLTLTGLDKLPDYEVGGQTYTALDYLQFVNPGDLRVVTMGKSCGECHVSHAECTEKSLLATSAGVLSGALYAIGQPTRVAESDGLYDNTASDMAFRVATDLAFNAVGAPFGAVSRMVEYPVFSARNNTNPDAIFNNDDYLIAELLDDQNADGTVVANSALANLYHEQVAFTCGDCHLGSAGANNRTGDYRSSGCTSCHMPYSLGGRAGTSDPNVNKFEPLDPDDIDEPERPHVRSHQIMSVAKTTANGTVVKGIDDHTCAGCHQGSNRTVMQYWGIRLDQNQDVRRGQQYPAQPVSYQNTSNDTRLFDPELGNREFNGRNRNQYLAFEDYDGDGRDDTPADVHHEAGMGCIDCHGSHDMHGGDVTAGSQPLLSRMEQAVSIKCEDCHGSSEAYATTVTGTTYSGAAAEVGVDSKGLPLRHVTKDANGNYWLKSRLDGEVHYLSQTRDIVVDTGKVHPTTGEPLYSQRASFAMGRADGNAATGIGPVQTNDNPTGFKHGDNMDCASCHSAWTNTCMGCHLVGEYNTGNNFSNITGERIVFREDDALFVYQSPVFFQLGVNSGNKITQTAANTKMFFSYKDRQNNLSEVFSFSDRNGGGKNPALADLPAMSHNAMMAHSIRGRVTAEDEGPRYCVSCHLTDHSIATYGTEYAAFRTAMQTGDFASLDYNLLRDHIGSNPGNQIDSPFFVHQVAGLGSGLFLFDGQGAPVNPLDNDANRAGAGGAAPATTYDPNRSALNLDRVVSENGVSNASSNHALYDSTPTPNLRDGATDPTMAGPMGMTLLQMLTDPTNGRVLDSWIDADGIVRGDATSVID